MSHNINVTNGRASFMSLRESAWHGLGQVIDRPVGSQEALDLSGLNWSAIPQNIFREDQTRITSHKAIVRSDTKRCLGIVGSDYSVVQNKELFDWFDGLNGFSDVTLETAGALGDGETVWVLARCNGLRFDIKGDEHQGYMLLANGHAGNRKLTLMPTVTRVVCNNTLSMATAGKRGNNLSSGWELRHTARIQSHLEAIRDLYVRTSNSWKATEAALTLLASKPATDEALTRLFTEPWAEPKKGAAAGDFSNAPIAAIKTAEKALADELADEENAPEEVSDRTNLMRDIRIQKLNVLLASETNQQPGTKDTLFSAFNAVTEYLEHEAPTRLSKDVPKAQQARIGKEKRFESTNFGGHNNRVKNRAYRLALELAEA